MGPYNYDFFFFKRHPFNAEENSKEMKLPGSRIVSSYNRRKRVALSMTRFGQVFGHITRSFAVRDDLLIFQSSH